MVQMSEDILFLERLIEDLKKACISKPLSEEFSAPIDNDRLNQAGEVIARLEKRHRGKVGAAV